MLRDGTRNLPPWSEYKPQRLPAHVARAPETVLGRLPDGEYLQAVGEFDPALLHVTHHSTGLDAESEFQSQASTLVEKLKCRLRDRPARGQIVEQNHGIAPHQPTSDVRKRGGEHAQLVSLQQFVERAAGGAREHKIQGHLMGIGQ